MSENKIIDEPEEIPDREDGQAAKAHPLRDALHRARQQEADREDVIVDLREAEIARLELLQDALSEVFEDVPEDTDLLECSLIAGTPPRLWIDVLGHVVMGRDKRTYRFLKDTRYGRQVILETTNLDEMSNRVTEYVAHRLIERERALESEADGKSKITLKSHKREDAPTVADSQKPAKRFGGWSLFFVFVLGVLAGAAALFALGLVLTSG
jgi:hypothetical protein